MLQTEARLQKKSYVTYQLAPVPMTFSDLINYMYIQEGQHPLTGQRAANFRLLANQ